MSTGGPPNELRVEGEIPAPPPSGNSSSHARGRRLVRLSLLAIMLKGLGVLLTFASQLVLARVLGVDGFGVYVTVIACATVLSLLGGLGTPLSSVRFLATYAEQGDWPGYRGFLWVATRLTALSSILVATLVLLIFASVPQLYAFLTAMATGTPLIFLLAASGLASGTFLAAQLPLHAEGFGNVTRPFLVSVFVGGAALSGLPVGANFALALTVFAGALALSFQVAGLWPVLRPRWRGPRQTTERSAWFASGAAFVMTTVAYSVTERLDTVLLSTLVSPATAAPYNVASRLALLVGVALAPVGAVLAPMLAQLLARGDRTGLQRALSQAVFLSTALAICFAAALLMFAPFLLGLFGKGFSGDITVFFVLVAGQVVLAMVGPAGYLLAIAGHNRLLIAASLSAAALDVLLCLVLIPRFGPLGASLSTAVSIAANGIVLATISWRQVKVDTTLVSAFRLLSQRKVGLA